jgi:hypothetical protein
MKNYVIFYQERCKYIFPAQQAGTTNNSNNKTPKDYYLTALHRINYFLKI